MEIKLSIIVPVYNAEKYIGHCLDSLLNQTLKEMEIVCVNDGSTDKSADILHRYAKRDRRIRIIHQENQGNNQARKAGYLSCRGGKYITLVDADDWLEPGIYEYAIRKLEETEADCAQFNCWMEYGDRQRRCGGVQEECLTQEEKFIRQFALAGLCKCSPVRNGEMEGSLWNKVYNRKIFDELYGEGKLFADTVRHYEDSMSTYRMLRKTQRLLLLPQYGYHYRKGNSQSLTGKYYVDLPPEKDFRQYEAFAKEFADTAVQQAICSMEVNLFWGYIVKHHYFKVENPMGIREQWEEIKALLAVGRARECYFPIKEALEGANMDWISNKIMRFLTERQMVTAFSLYLGSRISIWKEFIFSGCLCI